MIPVDRAAGLRGSTPRPGYPRAVGQVKTVPIEQAVNSENARSVPIQRVEIFSARIGC
jgi:hypothetical protein